MLPSLAYLFSQASFNQEHLDELFGLVLLMIGYAVRIEMLDWRGMLTTELALLTHGTQQPYEQLVFVEHLAGHTYGNVLGPLWQAQRRSGTCEIGAVEALPADELAHPGLMEDEQTISYWQTGFGRQAANGLAHG